MKLDQQMKCRIMSLSYTADCELKVPDIPRLEWDTNIQTWDYREIESKSLELERYRIDADGYVIMQARK